MISIQMKWRHAGSAFYLLKKRKEGRSKCLFGILLLMKIGLEISFSYELSPWYKVPCVFSQWPRLSELERHSRYLAYRLARHNWSADRFSWSLEDHYYYPVRMDVRYKYRILRYSMGNRVGFVPHYQLRDNFRSRPCNTNWPICRGYALAIQTTIGWKG